MTVRRLLEEIDSRELSEWMAYDGINPPADGWLQTGLLASAMANLWGGGKRTYKPADFMPKRKRQADDSAEQERREKSLLDRLFSAMRRRRRKE